MKRFLTSGPGVSSILMATASKDLKTSFHVKYFPKGPQPLSNEC